MSLLTAAPPLLTTGLLSAEISLLSLCPPSLSLSLYPGQNSEILLFSGYKSSLTVRRSGWADSAPSLFLPQAAGAGGHYVHSSLTSGQRRGWERRGREGGRERGDRLWAGKGKEEGNGV